jgi:hypothetical protein
MDDPRWVAAILVGCEPGELRGVRQLEDGGLVIVAPDGRKLIFSADQIAQVQERLLDSQMCFAPELKVQNKQLDSQIGFAPEPRPKKRPVAKKEARP